MANRKPSTPLKGGGPGRKGGPGATPLELRKYLQANTKEAIDMLITIMRAKDTPIRERLSAARAIIDKALAQPALTKDEKDAGAISAGDQMIDLLKAALTKEEKAE